MKSLFLFLLLCIAAPLAAVQEDDPPRLVQVSMGPLTPQIIYMVFTDMHTGVQWLLVVDTAHGTFSMQPIPEKPK